MSLMNAIRLKILAKQVPPIFTSSDLQNAKIPDPNNNLSNYDKKNCGSLNKNKKVLVSIEINGERYYTFDEQIFD